MDLNGDMAFERREYECRFAGLQKMNKSEMIYDR